MGLIFLVLSASAVPSGIYKDRNHQILVSDSQRFYVLDNEGNVKMRYQICEEQPDGSFHLLLLDERERPYPGVSATSRGAWWQENGEIRLNSTVTAWGPYTLQR